MDLTELDRINDIISSEEFNKYDVKFSIQEWDDRLDLIFGKNNGKIIVKFIPLKKVSYENILQACLDHYKNSSEENIVTMSVKIIKKRPEE